MKITIYVILLHLFVITVLVYFSPTARPIPHKPIAVKTYVYKQEIPRSPPRKQTPQPPKQLKEVQLDQPISPLAPPPEVAKPTPIPSNPIKKPTPKPAKKPASKPKQTQTTSAKKVAPKINSNQQKLIAMMQQSLNSLNSAGGGSTSVPVGSKNIGTLASEALSFETKYEEELIAYLESLLSLPEKGDVKLKLTLKREGSVQKLDIVKAGSERNRKYIESNLISCTFPSFGAHFKGEKSHTFTITLECGDDSPPCNGPIQAHS